MAYYTRSRAATEYRSAGVLPFAVSQGQVLALLGAELTWTGPDGRYVTYMFRDFGGQRESLDASAAATAARECAEETLGMLWGPTVDQAGVDAAAAAMAGQLSDPERAVCVAHALKRGTYLMYITQAPYISPLMLRLAREQNAETAAVACAEKSAFAWVPLRALLQCVAVSQGRYVLEAPAAVCGGPGTPRPCGRGLRRFPLHPCFATSLRAAQACGLPDLLARARALPLPPPPLLPAAVAAAAAGLAGEGDRPAEAVCAAAGDEHTLQVQPECDDHDTDAGSSWLESYDSGAGLGYWLQQAELAAVLRGPAAADDARVRAAPEAQTEPAVPQAAAAACAAASAAASASQASGLPLAPALREVEVAAAHGAALAGLTAAAARWRQQAERQACGARPPDTPSGSSLASSLRESRLAQDAAAASEVVDQITRNMKQGRRKRQRQARKKRREEERRRQQAQQQQRQQHKPPPPPPPPPPEQQQQEQEAEHLPGRSAGKRQQTGQHMPKQQRVASGHEEHQQGAATTVFPQPHIAGPGRRQRLAL